MARPAILLLSCAAAAAAAPLTLKLSSGELTFASPPPPAAAGPWVALFDATPSTLGNTHANLIDSLTPCGASVEGYLPPSSYLFFVPAARAEACLTAAGAVPRLLALSPLPPALRLSPSLQQPRDATQPPVRTLSLSLAGAASHLGALEAELLPHLSASGATLVPAGGNVVKITTLATCSEACTLSSPADCGCALSEGLLAAVAAHESVVWVEEVYPARLFNAFTRGMMEVPDVYNDPSAAAENGACANTCPLNSNLPLSQLQTAFPGFPQVRRAKEEARELQGGCAAPCNSAACGFGYGQCTGVTSTPTSNALLDGTGQTVQVIDAGLDFRQPFFEGGALTISQTGGPAPTSAGTHRKVASYWAYADDRDWGTGITGEESWRGHGTHVAGTIAGDAARAPGIVATDAPVLTAVRGVAPGARLAVVDVVCNTPLPGGCPIGSTRTTVCKPDGRPCIPDDLSPLLRAAEPSGAFISSMSWGNTGEVGSGSNGYGDQAAFLDAYTWSHPNHLLIFAAGNDGPGGDFNDAGRFLSMQAVAKNVISVGGLNDGLPGHMSKTLGSALGDVAANRLPPLYQSLSGRACGGILNSIQGTGGAPYTCPATATLTPGVCYELAAAGGGSTELPSTLINFGTSQQGGFPIIPNDDPGSSVSAAQIRYALGSPGQAELALCCGCSLQQVVQGCQAMGTASPPNGDCTSPEATNAFLLDLTKTYSARQQSVFASNGPADGTLRIKVRYALLSFASFPI